MDLNTVLNPYDTHVRIYNTSWIFKVLQDPNPLQKCSKMYKHVKALQTKNTLSSNSFSLLKE